MMSNSEFGSISFDLPKNQSNVIKVIGVGGGGSNAINHMFKQGIKGVDFIICNTDSQALQNSPCPKQDTVRSNLTEGLGAGANPEVGQQSAIRKYRRNRKNVGYQYQNGIYHCRYGWWNRYWCCSGNCQLAKEREILTVGIVTIPFQFEGKVRQNRHK